MSQDEPLKGTPEVLEILAYLAALETQYEAPGTHEALTDEDVAAARERVFSKLGLPNSPPLRPSSRTEEPAWIDMEQAPGDLDVEWLLLAESAAATVRDDTASVRRRLRLRATSLVEVGYKPYVDVRVDIVIRPDENDAGRPSSGTGKMTVLLHPDETFGGERPALQISVSSADATVKRATVSEDGLGVLDEVPIGLASPSDLRFLWRRAPK